jgi:hypothetical protein
MRKLLGVLLVVSACSAGSPNGPPTHAEFVPNGNLIEVVVNDPRPVHSVQLISPDGKVIEAKTINTERTIAPAYSPGPSLGLGVGGFNGSGSSGFGSGVGIGLPLGGSQPTTSESVSTATISLPDPAGYRREWQRYRIEVQIGAPPSTLTLNAPPPPG